LLFQSIRVNCWDISDSISTHGELNVIEILGYLLGAEFVLLTSTGKASRSEVLENLAMQICVLGECEQCVVREMEESRAFARSLFSYTGLIKTCPSFVHVKQRRGTVLEDLWALGIASGPGEEPDTSGKQQWAQKEWQQTVAKNGYRS